MRDLEERVEQALAGLAQPEAVREGAQELVRALMDMYGRGLARLVGLIGQAEIERLAEDEVFGALLILHDLHPLSASERIERVLGRLREHSASGVRLVGLDGVDERGVARLELAGSGRGCGCSTAALRESVAQAVLDAAPEVTEVVWVRTSADEPVLLQIGRGPR